ncbi:MAG: glycosyltransferase family 2 protein [Planctomycetota bacterium]
MPNGMISVALATYNGEPYLRAQLDSIFSQSYSELEVVAVDDGSTDATVAILEEYAAKYPLEIHRNAENLGFVRNFEKAVSLCRGDFVALADQDDIWYPQKLERLRPLLDDNLLVYSDADLIDEHGASLGTTLRDLYGGLRFVRGSHPRSFLLAECVSGNTMVMRRELLDHALPIPDGVPYHDIWISFVASARGTIDYVDSSLLQYRRHTESITVDQAARESEDTPRNWFRKRARAVTRLQTMAACPSLRPNDRRFVDRLAALAGGFRRRWFSVALFWLVWRSGGELFATRTRPRVLPRALFHARGYRLHRWKLRLALKRRLTFWRRPRSL